MKDMSMVASHQWASRPDDERFLSLADLAKSVANRRYESWTTAPSVRELQVNVDADALDANILLTTYDVEHGEDRQLEPTNWSFNQLAQYAGAPAGYLRKLHPVLAATNLQYGLTNLAPREDVLVLGQTNGKNVLRSITTPSYGRIWDAEVVEAVIRMNRNGMWQVPAASYATSNPLRATTLYASDRDVFMFLVDPEHPIMIPGKSTPMFRGFFMWNSEVGKCTFGSDMFLYDYVCDNRIVWGMTMVKQLRIRHTSGAPDRFLREAQGYLRQYANESTQPIIEAVVKAQEKVIDLSGTKGSMVDWLQKRGLTKVQAQASVQSAQAENGGADTLWQIVSGVTAYARSIKHTDTRVEVERVGGSLMDMVSGK